MPRQMMVAPGGGVGALGGPVGGGGLPLGVPPVNGGVAQTQPAVLVQGQVQSFHTMQNVIISPFLPRSLWQQVCLPPPLSRTRSKCSASACFLSFRQEFHFHFFGKMFPIFHFYFWQKISIFSGNISWPGWQSYWDAAGHWQCRDPSHAGRSQFSEGTGIRIVFNWFSDWHLFNFSGGEGCGFVPSPPGNCQGGEGGEGTKRTDKGDRRRLKQRKQTKKKKGRPSLQWMICLEIFQGGKGGVIFNQRNYLADFFLF